MSYAVTLRRREIAVRSALGATRRDILGMVLGTGVKVTVVGVLTGAVASVFASRTLAGMVFGVDPFDPLTFAASAALLSAVAVVACYRPALAAASVDPLTVLRQ
jgi:putative ABC transport system permease protein